MRNKDIEVVVKSTAMPQRNGHHMMKNITYSWANFRAKYQQHLQFVFVSKAKVLFSDTIKWSSKRMSNIFALRSFFWLVEHPMC